jgi:ribosomal protein L32
MEQTEIPVDWSIVKCKNCGETKKRFRSGIYPNNKDQRWVDEHGKQWSGHVCASCVRERARLRKQAKTKTKPINV